ncbi:hypothetical protein JI739_06805 [Ramlibacter sp. AW1]|uniref:Uncharacterized protein n=1 Tax=Ramlibacter aurantiacus TaxID=2801330 RepID=A0A936ZEG0_9BURK|nr:hypothetical protein [Ramlibacter aurantiacus]MBL0420054.1 hypothetical protein [Ramlibacter aurantiacus]
MEHLTQKLREWSAAHAEARKAEHAFSQQQRGAPTDLQDRARQLRQQADRLHRQIYDQIGSRRPS